MATGTGENTAWTLREPFIQDCGNQYDHCGKNDVDASALIGGHIGLQPGAMFRRYRLRGTCLPAALLSRSASDAHCRQRSAIRFQVTLLFGSRVNRAIFSQSVACRKNSSWGFIGAHPSKRLKL